MATDQRPQLFGLGACALLVGPIMPFLASATRVAAGTVLVVLAAVAVLVLERGPRLHGLLALIAGISVGEVVIAAIQDHPSTIALVVQTLVLGFGLAAMVRLRTRLIPRDHVVEDKDELLSIISHQLRTPLTAVVGFADLLRSQPDMTSAEERRSMLADLSTHAFELSAMFDDLLVASRAELDDLEVVSVRVNLRSQLNQELETWVVDDELGDRIQVTGEGPVVRGDPGRIRHVLHNLISNALRHGGPGIRIECGELDGQGRVIVADNGPGIPVELAEGLFEPYRRATPTLTPGPLGLGLSVARYLSQLMGGDILYERREGWTEFHFVLPLGAPSAHSAARPQVQHAEHS